MSAKNNYLRKLARVMSEDTRYDPEAYFFIHRALEFLLRGMKERRHVSGQELLEGIRRYALREFGPMSRDVLKYWGVRRCEDFGEMVFNMVDNGLLKKTPEDSKDDFRAGFDFREAFDKPFRPSSRPRKK